MISNKLLTISQLKKRLNKLPKVNIGHLPTPLDYCKNLTKTLDGPKIFIIRDDCTGITFGGNKVRHNQFLMGKVLEQGFDSYINVMDWRSNNARLAAAFCNLLNLDYHLVLRGGENKPIQGNLLIYNLLKANIYPQKSSEAEKAFEFARNLQNQLTSQGKKPFLAQDQAYSKIAGILGYLYGAIEIHEQLERIGCSEVHFFSVVGRSLAGLALAAKNLGFPWKFTGIEITKEFTPKEYVFNNDSVGSVVSLLNLPQTIKESEITVLDSFVGKEYGDVTEDSKNAVHLLAQTESIIVEPNYTGKSLAGLMHQIKAKKINSNEIIIFLHTGGTPSLFLYNKELIS